MMSGTNTREWFALYTQPRQEYKAGEQISALNIENYLPLITTQKKWSDRIKKVTEPLIRGYIFIYANEKERLEAITANSVINTICFGGKPAVIPTWQIVGLQKMLEHPDELLLSNRILKGSIVRIVSGPMSGIIGIVEQHPNNENYLSLSIEIANRTVSVKLPSDFVAAETEPVQI